MRTRRQFLWIITLFVACFVISPLPADTKINVNNISLTEAPLGTLYVKADGDCSGRQPCYTTIQAAINAATDEDAIWVCHGDYIESVVLDASKGLRLSCGWDDGFQTRGLFSSVNAVIIQKGTLIVDNLVVRSACPDDLLTKAFAALTNRDILKARGYFASACLEYGDQISNNADTARFFYALTRVGALWFDMGSDGNPNNGLNTLGDVLDAFGCGIDGRDPWDLNESLLWPDTFPSTSPTGGHLQAFLYHVVRPEIEGAIHYLDRVSHNFNRLWTEPFAGTTVESDYGDVLFFRAIAWGMLGAILIQNGYDLDMDIASAVNDEAITIEDFLRDHPTLLSLIDDASVSTAKACIRSGLTDISDAIDWIQSETDHQADDLINLTDVTGEDIEDAKEQIADAMASLDGPYTFDGTDTPLDPRDDTIADISAFFAGIDLRSLLPWFAGDHPVGFLPDPTLGGMLITLQGKDPNDLNEDHNGNGAADIFDDSIYYVYGGHDISEDVCPYDSIGANPEGYGFTFLGESTSPAWACDFGGAFPFYLIRGRSLTEGAKIDAFGFLGAGAYCCLASYDNLEWWQWRVYSGPPDYWYVTLGYEHYILLSAPAATTGIRVYGLP